MILSSLVHINDKNIDEWGYAINVIENIFCYIFVYVFTNIDVNC